MGVFDVFLVLQGAIRPIKSLLTPTSPLSSRGLGRRPLTAETRVRIPVAVLQKSRVHGVFVVLGLVRHSRDRLPRVQIGVEALSGLLFAARNKVPVAVPGLAHIAVSGPAHPSPGYVDRIRAVADSCEHVAATMLNASDAAGVRWRSKADLADGLPYELQRAGNRPGPAKMWEEFDAAFERLPITATGTDIVAVAHGFSEVWNALRRVADELERVDDWQAWERTASGA